MKLILLATVAAVFLVGLVSAQTAKKNEALGQEIRKLDQAEADALLRKDVPALEKLWAEDFTVNNPRNTISKGREAVIALIRDGSIDYSSFEREIETMLFYRDSVIVMGLEIIKPAGKAAMVGQTVRRRFTNIWMKRKGKWLLTVRHANIICPN